MSPIVITVLCCVFGLIIGSFLTVCIYRLPLGRPTDPLNPLDEDEGEEVEVLAVAPQAVLRQAGQRNITVWFPPRSFCTSCGARLLWWHNIPLFSWLFLGGRCAFCSAHVSIRYPLVEILTALLALLSYCFYGLTPTALVIFAFSCSLLVLSLIDIDFYIIPNKITLPGVIAGFLVAGINHFFHIFSAPVSVNLIQAFLGLLAGGGFLYLVAEVYFRLRRKEGLGMGDVKLLAMTGAFFGVQGALYTIFVGSVLGAVLGGLHVLISRSKWSQPLPFGPYLAFANLLYLFSGDRLLAVFLQNIFAGR